jgi:hypothetical protein
MLDLDIGLLIYDTPFRQRRLGFVTLYNMGEFIHILLVIAIVTIV